MHFSKSSSNSSTASSSGSANVQTGQPAPQQLYRIPSVVTERPGQAYNGEPQDMSTPEFVRSGSFVRYPPPLPPTPNVKEIEIQVDYAL